jgi:hypothetical protein
MVVSLPSRNTVTFIMMGSLAKLAQGNSTLGPNLAKLSAEELSLICDEVISYSVAVYLAETALKLAAISASAPICRHIRGPICSR